MNCGRILVLFENFYIYCGRIKFSHEWENHFLFWENLFILIYCGRIKFSHAWENFTFKMILPQLNQTLIRIPFLPKHAWKNQILPRMKVKNFFPLGPSALRERNFLLSFEEEFDSSTYALVRTVYTVPK